MPTLTAIQIQGNLIAPDMTAELIAGNIKGQNPEDFGLTKTNKLADEIATAWGDAKAYWAAFQRRLAKLDANDIATSLTREQWAVPLLESLGFQPVYTAKAEIVDGQTYAISHRTEEGENKPPIHIIGCRGKLEQRPPSGMPRLSAHALMQEYLNRTEHLWGIVTNGLQWRLLRDSSLMTRLTYIEFDLEQILNGENFAEFGLFYRLFHRSRLPQRMDEADKCLLEFYHQEAIQQGGRVRDRLRDGVEQALIRLGTGFLQHPDNEELRQKFTLPLPSGRGIGSEGKDVTFYRQLLLLIYRLLFLMVAESRNLLLADEDIEKARIYQEYYSVERVRMLAERPSYRREGFQDLWQGLRITFRLFDENWRGQLLGLSPLNGDLFGSDTLQDLDNCGIDNHDLMVAIRQLSLYQQKGQLQRVNYGALDVEELGSIYESLLDFHPLVVDKQGIFDFQLVRGSDRKTSGSYYTPPELVGQLIKSALEPVIEEKVSSCVLASGGAEAQQRTQEQALLSIKVCDPACGSGHFLLAAARRIGKELAKVRTGEMQPSPEPLRQAIRDVIQRCIYGVDLNPLAVDLCKVALWIEGFCRGLPLNFLDHRIKCGNSLVGVLDLDCLDEGIPDEAFKAVTGDDKKLATQFKKRNKKERETDLQGQLSLFDNLENQRAEYGKSWRKLGEIGETTTYEVREKQQKYRENRENPRWWQDYSACNLWTAAFFMPLTEENLQFLPTTAALSQLLRGNVVTKKVVDAANQLQQEKRFFHWCLEFPEVFEAGGFDCVLGNPPWERIKLEEKEFFASRSAEIANAANKAAREKLIKELPKINPQLSQAFGEAKHDADAQSKFIRESGRFPLTAVGDLNTYAVFAETTRKVISPLGRVGVILPTGIVTNDTTKAFFENIVICESLVSVVSFENEHFFFPDVGNRFSFCLLNLSGEQNKKANPIFVYHCHNVIQLNQKERFFQLSKEDIKLINPNTLTCPIFRSNQDANLTKKIYQRVPVLENEQIGSNPWGISFMSMFHMANDSGLFKNEASDGLVPLYEGKMFFIYDHRYGCYTDEMLQSGQVNFKGIPTPTLEDLQNPDFTVKPRYWIEKRQVDNRLAEKGDKEWLLAFRDVTNSTNERTAIFTVLPKIGVGHKAPLIFLNTNQLKSYSLLLANFNSLVLDYVVRQKIGGNSLSYFILKQLPVIPPETYTQKDIEFISSRVLELVYTAWDMQPFAKDMGYAGDPFIWDNNRRALLRAELDAYYAKLYGLTRDELRYILDPADVYGEDFPSETFRVLKNNEIRQFGEYRTQRLVLAAWDMLGF